MKLSPARPGYDDGDETQTRRAIEADVSALQRLLATLQSTVASGSGAADYLYNPADPNALLSKTLTVGKFYAYEAGRSPRQSGAGGVVFALDALGVGTPNGKFVYDSGVDELVTVGQAGIRLALVPGSGNIVDVRAANLVCDATINPATNQCNGGTVGQQAQMHALRDWAISRKVILTGGGNYRIEQGGELTMKSAWLAWGDMRLICSVGFVGWMLTLPDGFQDTLPYQCDVWLHGDNQAFASASAARGVKFYNNSGAGQTVRAKVYYLNQGADFRSNMEDLNAEVYGEQCNFLATVTDRALFVASIGPASAVMTVTSLTTISEIEVGMTLSGTGVTACTVINQLTGTAGQTGTYTVSVSQTAASTDIIGLLAGSPDDTLVLVQGHNCKHWVYCLDGTDSSFRWTMNVQNRTTSGDGIAATQFPTGKNAMATGLMRGHNGPEDCIKLSKDHGVSSFHFGMLLLEHGYGTGLNLEWIQSCTGEITLRQWDDAANGPAGGTSVTGVVYGRIQNGGGLKVNILDHLGTYPFQVGDTTGTYFPINGDLPLTNVQSGNPEPYLGTYSTGYAGRLFKGQNFSLTLLQADGNIKTEVGVSRCSLTMKATWVISPGNYTFNVSHTAPNVQVNFTGAMNSADIFSKAWLFDGVRADYLIDYYGGAAYDGAKWRLT